MPTPIEGFQYPIAGALVEDERLRAGACGGEAFEAACALQTPVPVAGRTEPSAAGSGGASSLSPTGPIGGPEFACLSELGFSEGPAGTCFLHGPERGARLLRQAVLCSHYGECTSTACGARRDGEVRLDAALSDSVDRLEGTLLGIAMATA